MLLLKRILLLFFVIQCFTFIELESQYTVNSPYSIFGIGDKEFQGFTQNRSMGGWGISKRLPNQINILNPAAATAQDSMSFLWDIGLKGSFVIYQSQTASNKQNSFNFDHLAFSAAVNNTFVIGAGIVPFTKIGYNFTEKYNYPDEEIIQYEYTGNGNINRFYTNFAYAFLNKKLNIGYQFSYVFGNITKSTYANFVTSSGESYGKYSFIYDDFAITGLQHTLGLQTEIPIVTSSLLLGLVYEPSISLSCNRNIHYARGVDTLSYEVDSGNFKIPARIGVGLSFKLNSRLTTGVDLSTQDWSKAQMFNQKDSMQRSFRIGMGTEYVFDKDSYKSYWSKVRIRAGLYYEQTYLRLKNQSINDYGFSVGFSFPLKRSHSFFHVGFEMGKRGTTSFNLLEDNYKRLFISLSLYDYWFFKRKFD